jgi:hypothetical protein
VIVFLCRRPEARQTDTNNKRIRENNMTNSHKHDVQEIYFYIYHVHELKRNVVRDTSLYKFLKSLPYHLSH